MTNMGNGEHRVLQYGADGVTVLLDECSDIGGRKLVIISVQIIGWSCKWQIYLVAQEILFMLGLEGK